MTRKKVIIYIILTVAGLYFLFPFYWMFVVSLKQPSEIYASPPTWLPVDFNFLHYVNIFKETYVPTFFANSVGISVSVTLITVFLAFIASYGLSRFRFKLRRIVFLSILLGQLLPGSVRFIPLYTVFVKVGLQDTYAALIITYVGWVLPFSILMLTGYLSSVPIELEESAMIDGCPRYRIIYKIVFPLAAPGIAATMIYSFVNCWQEFMFGLVLIQDTAKKTLPVGLMYFKGEYNINWGNLMAATVVAVIPVTVIFVVFQKAFTAGLTKGAIKQ